MECGAGFTYDADTNLTGPEAIRFTFQAAASNGLTVVRTFGHGHDAFKSIVLQPRAGTLLAVTLLPMLSVCIHLASMTRREDTALPSKCGDCLSNKWCVHCCRHLQ